MVIISCPETPCQCLLHRPAWFVVLLQPGRAGPQLSFSSKAALEQSSRMCFVDEWPVIELGSGEDPDHVIPTTEWLCLRLSRLSLSLSLENNPATAISIPLGALTRTENSPGRGSESRPEGFAVSAKPLAQGRRSERFRGLLRVIRFPYTGKPLGRHIEDLAVGR